ncbi:uncharacterized protein LOC119072243 isoform X2 [Bradysia coprophila]|uniref:uncharacterized protein LOC119072243 isoform X2 n=1 Tax=Bradysia coprophila TaxID=38358 RepID=UPI00187DC988|nr:uncharacterized protein LOC119072243 isoform X2 [Bradysia coprophila]
MERTGLTMALLQMLLLLLYALPSLSLPITSNPLGLEDTPDNLAYHTQSLEGPSEHEGVRKIAKSIFITPNHPDFHMSCPNGYQMKDGECAKIPNFEVNHLALITAQLEQFLDNKPTTSDYDEYDYDSYGDVTESAEPFHVPLSVSFEDEEPVRDKYNDGIQNMPFLADDSDGSEETSQKNPSSTGPKTTDGENVAPSGAAVATNVDKWTDDNLAYNKDGTRMEHDIDPTTSSDVVVVTTPSLTSTTHKKVLVDPPQYMLSQKQDEHTPTTENELDPITFVGKDGLGDSAQITVFNNETEAQHLDQEAAGNNMVQNHIESTTQSDDQNNLDKELQSESLFKDDSVTGTSINVSDGTTEMNENDIEVTTQPLNSFSDKENSVSAPVLLLETSSKIEQPVVVVPTVEQVQIVTPVHPTTTSHSTTSHHRRKSHNQSTPSSAHTSELQTAERLNINESMLNKKLRESVMKHELNEDAIETIDTNNRFVYTHLDSSASNEPETPSSSSSPTTMQPTITQQNQPSPLNIFSNFKGGTIKFPGPVQQRATEPLFNRLIPDIIPKKPPETSGARPLFSWLPAGTSFDFNRNVNPAFMRFWNKMPLIRDRAMASNATSSSSEQPRSNSKSPTDNLYKDAPVSEVYKVISSRNYKHDNR